MMARLAILSLLEIISLWQSPLFAKQVKRAFREFPLNVKLPQMPNENDVTHAFGAP